MRLLLLLFFMTAATVYSQPWVQGSAGMTNRYFSGELQAGIRFGAFAASAGYNSLQFDSDQPVLLSARAGVLLDERWFLFAGYVRVLQSSDNKELNSNSWQVGGQYHFGFYDRGSFYVTSFYTWPDYVSAGVGMTFNLFK